MDLNQFSTVDIVLDKANDNIIQRQTISAGDRDGRSLTLQVTNEGSIGEVPGLTANLLWTNHSSGLSDLSAFSVVDRTTSVFKIEYPQNMLTAGKVTAQIQLLYGGKVTHSKKFEVIVLDVAGSLKGVLQTAEYSALVTTLAKANEFETEIAEVTAQLVQTATQVNSRIDGIIVTPSKGITEQEILDARQGLNSLGANLTAIKNEKNKYIDNPTSHNLYDKTKAIDWGLIQNTPTSPLAMYERSVFSGLLPVESGKTYLITQPMRAVGAIFAWGATVTAPSFNVGAICAETASGGAYGSWVLDKTKMTRVNKVTTSGFNAVELTIIDPSIKFIGWHMHSDDYWAGHTTTQFNDLINATQVVEGVVEKPYQPYEIYRIKESALPESIITLFDGISRLGKDITVFKQGADISVRVPWSDTLDYFTLWKYPNGDTNNGLNMIGEYTCLKSVPLNVIDTSSVFKIANDDVTPLYLNIGYIGANHGFQYIQQITATGHGKTNADIGSLWSQGSGVPFILIDIVNENTLKFIQDYAGAPNFPAGPLTNATGTLTHVSGATNPTNIIYTAKLSVQLFPNTNRKSIALVLDGKEIKEDGVYQGDKFDIVEKYNIYNIPSLQTYLKANVGSLTKPNLADDTLLPWFTVTNVFSHGRNGSITVKTGYEVFVTSNISSLGIVQSQTIGSKAYVPDVGIVDSKDMSTVVTQGTGELLFSKATWLNAEKPPYRYHQFNDDLSKGMALGYNTQFGVAKPVIRKLNTGAGNFNGSTKKMYPNVYSGGTVVAGDYKEAVAFRVPLRNIDSDATCLYWYWVGDDIYLAFDYHKNIDKTIELPSYLVGKKIEQLDIHANTTIQSEIVSAKGIKAKVINNYGFGVLRLYD